MPSQSTAETFDALIKELDLIAPTSDTMLSIEEFALGMPLATRPLDVCWGFAPIDAEIVADSASDLIVGKGLCRRDGLFQPPVVTETGFKFTDSSILGTAPLSNVYAFGSAFLHSGTAGVTPTIEIVLCKGGASTPLLLCQQIDLNSAKELHAQNRVTAAIAPSGGYALELFKFVVDITTYSYTAPWTNDFQVYPLDTRKIRGFGGFADENMATSMVPTIITAQANISTSLIAAQNAVKTLVSDWVLLTSWTPDFVSYWRTNYTSLPSRLKDYLQSEIGIVILPPGP